MKRITTAFIVFLVTLIMLKDTGSCEKIFELLKYVPWGDKIGHFLLMGMFSFLLNIVLYPRRCGFLLTDIQKGTVIATILVTLEEMTHMFLDTRSFSVADLASDYTGIFFFGKIAWYLMNNGKLPAGRIRKFQLKKGDIICQTSPPRKG